MFFCPIRFLYLFFLVGLEISCNFNFILLSKKGKFSEDIYPCISLFQELVSLNLAQIMTSDTSWDLLNAIVLWKRLYFKGWLSSICMQTLQTVTASFIINSYCTIIKNKIVVKKDTRIQCF